MNSRGGDDAKSKGSTRVSSFNSLASLITERRKSVMQNKGKKNKEDMGLLFFVIVLFLILVIGISLIHYYYHQHLLELSLFKRLKYNEEERLLELFDEKGGLSVISKMGTTFNQYSKPEECTEYLKYLYERLDDEEDKLLIDVVPNVTDIKPRKRRIHEFAFDNETVCLDWAQMARVQIHRAPIRGSANCYNVFWLAHQTNMDLQDCIVISDHKSGAWWGIGEISHGGYPLSTIDNLQSTPFMTSSLEHGPWGTLLRRAFVSSKGGLLTISSHLSASVSVNDGHLCIATNASGITNTNPLTLNYTICSASNISSSLLYLDYLANDPPPRKVDAMSDEELRKRILQRIDQPVWIPYIEGGNNNLTEESILDYADQILTLNYSHWGHILLPQSWQLETGNLDFDPERFPSPKNMTEMLARKGFGLALTIGPVVSTDTKDFKTGAFEGLWVLQKDSPPLPILVQDENVVAGALTDFTNKKASEWYTSKLRDLKKNYGIETFHLRAPGSSSVSVYHKFSQDIKNPDLYFSYFLDSVRQISPPLSTESAIVPPPLPTFVTVGTQSSGWESLETLVPRILTLSMLGYPLIDAGVIGGIPDRPGNIPDDELFIRWVQVVSFLPAFQIHAIPTFYKPETKNIVSNFIQRREQYVIPRLKKTLEKTLKNRTPLISPVSLLYSSDIHATGVSDEWIVGDDLLVAPVMQEGKTTRNIYIPDGLWENQSDGRLKRGPGWIYNHHVPLSEVALFIKRHSIDLSS